MYVCRHGSSFLLQGHEVDKGSGVVCPLFCILNICLLLGFGRETTIRLTWENFYILKVYLFLK